MSATLALPTPPIFSRRTFLGSAAAAATAALLPRSIPAATPAERPNILLVLADDLGMECLSSYGGTSYATPNVDQLAKNGLRFTRCYSNPLCSPSRVALMTGQYNYRNYNGWGVFDPQKQRTFGHMLKDAGYTTSLSGKWQFDNFEKHPNHVRDCGFDEYCAWTWHLGGKRTPRYSNPSLWQDGKLMEGVQDKYGPDIHNDFVIDFIRRNQSKPFLAYYPMSLVHGPFERTPDSKNAGRKRGPQFYPDMVAYMDKLLGKVFGVLDELKLREKTLILFTGDNGTPRPITSKAGDKTIPGGKGTMADTGSHVPLIAHWPGVTPVGQTCDDLVNFTDFLPTFADATGATRPQDRPIDGHSFLPAIRGEKGRGRNWSLIELNDKRFVMCGNYKLDHNGNLFDLSESMNEKLVDPANESKEAAEMRKNLPRLLNSIPRGKKESGNVNE